MAQREGSHEERLRELRERLYSRGVPPPLHGRGALPDEVHEVKSSWDADVLEPRPREVPNATPHSEPIAPLLPMTRKRFSYRTKFVVAGVVFFILALLLSGSFLLFGKNIISGDNIVIEARSDLFAVGGGEEFLFQITIANQNAVPIEAATLIIQYPYGTQAPDSSGKELYRERKQLDPLRPGETINVPLRARIFGEENEEKIILASIEYRVQGSNATFFKEASSLPVKISSSPVVLFIENVTKISSGQEVELEISVSSNSPSPLSEVLIKAEYPAGFDFSSADPAPVYGSDTWSVSDLEPEDKRIITLRGILLGKQDETKIFKFSAGVPNERDKFTLASIFTTQTESINIEEPFLDIEIVVNGRKDASPVIPPETPAAVSIVFTNTLGTTLYDGKITVHLSGSGLDDSEVDTQGRGFYDSSTNVATWDGRSVKSLEAIQPGQSSTVTLTLTPKTGGRTPQVSLDVDAEGKRIAEDRASQTLSGTASKTIKVESVVKLLSSMLYSIGAFPNTGPIPPEAEKVTTYTAFLYVKNGTNAFTDGVVTATLPPYVTWLDLSTSPQTFSYNPQSREVSWKVGDLAASEEQEAAFQISFKPSVTQVGEIVALLNGQRFRATDRFTGTVIRAEADVMTTQLSADPEYEHEDGRVRKKDE